jgi:hypothetical protein
MKILTFLQAAGLLNAMARLLLGVRVLLKF